MKKIIIIFILLIISAFLNVCDLVYSQNSVKGIFPKLARQQIKLFGFSGFDKYIIDSTQIDEDGDFFLSYNKNDYGMGFLSTEDNMPFFVILSGLEIKLKGESFKSIDKIKVLEGEENQYFAQYATEHQRRVQALNAWAYLEKIYQKDSLFAVQNKPKQTIISEMKRLKTEDSLFLASLPSNSYARYYLPLRKLVSSVSSIAQYRTKEIPAVLASFRKIDYSDTRLQKSGLLTDVIESHFWLIENSGYSLDSVYSEMNKSIDILIEKLKHEEKKLNEVTEYLFKFLEKRSLFKSSEYLALKLLNEQSCTINKDFADQLENYRAMKKGNTAPDFDFGIDIFAPGYKANNQPKKLSDIESKYAVVVFGASWCPQCKNDILKVSQFYKKWKEQDVEVVFVSLDENKKLFEKFTSKLPFISMCDYLKWESPIVKNYHVFATPTLFLLDDKRKIILRPNSVNQLDSWIDWYLVKGNE